MRCSPPATAMLMSSLCLAAAGGRQGLRAVRSGGPPGRAVHRRVHWRGQPLMALNKALSTLYSSEGCRHSCHCGVTKDDRTAPALVE